MSPVISLAQQLIQAKSVTPEDAGCQPLMRSRLEAVGFKCEDMNFEDVTNFWAVHGSEGPLLALCGHTDVVPTGDEALWQIPPFEARIENGILHGRGTADMKGSLAAMVVATERFVTDYPNHSGRIAYLITSDEEGDAYHGTEKVVQALKARGEMIDMALVGEPSSTNVVGDVIKNGRRGSLFFTLRVIGIQGHVAYPHLARNPIHQLAPALSDLAAEQWDSGNDYFPPTSFQVANINGGTGASNVIPGYVDLMCSFRFSTEVTAAELEQRTRAILDKHGLEYEAKFELKGHPFLTDSGPLVESMVKAVEAVRGEKPVLSTAGGTSDGRFIAAEMDSQVVELGPVNATIHKVDEQVAVADLEALEEMYYLTLKNLFA